MTLVCFQWYSVGSEEAELDSIMSHIWITEYTGQWLCLAIFCHLWQKGNTPCHTSFIFCEKETASWSAAIRLPVFLEDPRLKHEFITWILFYRVSNMMGTASTLVLAGCVLTKYHCSFAGLHTQKCISANHTGKNLLRFFFLFIAVTVASKIT